MNQQDRIREILQKADPVELRSLFAFNKNDKEMTVLFKFKAWSRYFFSHYFTSPDAPFHKEMDLNTLRWYRGNIDSYTDIAFRGAAKTARKQLFIAFAICNDTDHHRRFFKIMGANDKNIKQSVVDIYNMLVRVASLYPEVFEKSELKREETKDSFNTSTGIRVLGDTVGTNQRGSIQDGSRPDAIWFDDFENRETLRSAVKSKAIWDNMEEARTGLAVGGSTMYTCNYISETGNVHRLVVRGNDKNPVSIIPILTETGEPAWVRYTLADIAEMKRTDDDFEGERMCKPSTQRNVYFDREALDKQVVRQPIETKAGFKIYHKYDPSKLYGSGHDVSGGVGLDSSTSVFLEFGSNPVKVAAVFADNTIKPDVFGDEIKREADEYSNPLVAIEQNNHGHATIARAKQLEVNLYATTRNLTKIDEVNPTEYGWKANYQSVAHAMSELARAIHNNEIEINDAGLLQELKSYTRDDSMDKPADPRLTTRHFDLLRALAIAWQMRNHVFYESNETEENFTIYGSNYR